MSLPTFKPPVWAGLLGATFREVLISPKRRIKPSISVPAEIAFGGNLPLAFNAWTAEVLLPLLVRSEGLAYSL